MGKSRRCMVKPWLTVRVDDLGLFVKMVCSLYGEHDKPHLSWVEDLEPGHKWVFRGQSNVQWDILSTLERNSISGFGPYKGLKKLEQKLVEEFVREASCHMSFNGWGLIDVLALMRHYRAPTRLVDFSESPFVALYFGIEDKEPQDDFCVWAVCIDALKEFPQLDDVVDARTPNVKLIRQENSRELCKRFEDNFWRATERRTLPNMFYAFPRHGNAKLSAQSGLVLLQSALGRSFMADLTAALGCGDKRTSIALTEIYAKDRIFDAANCSKLIQFTFSHDLSESCSALLRSMNITPKILYPGLEGICKSLSRYVSTISLEE